MRRAVRSAVGVAIVATLVVALLGAIAAGPGAAGPPPKSVCGICGDSLAGASGPGTLDVYVDDAGDSRWVARVPVDDAYAHLYRERPDALEEAVDEGWYRYDLAADDARGVEATLDDGAVVVTFRVDDVAAPGVGGAWVLDYFYAAGTNTRYELGAEEVRIHVPEGAAVTNEPPHATAGESTVTWSRHGRRSTGDFSTRTYVTYGDPGVVGTLSSWATAVVAFGPLKAKHALIAGALPVTALALGAVGAKRAGRGKRGLATVLPGALTGAGRAFVDVIPARRPHSPRRSIGRRHALGIVPASAATVAVATALVFGPSAIVEPVAFTVAVTLFVPLGYACEADERTWPFLLAASMTPLVPLVAYAPYVGFGFGAIFVGVLFLFWALAAVLVGVPLSAVGRHVARREATGRS